MSESVIMKYWNENPERRIAYIDGLQSIFINHGLYSPQSLSALNEGIRNEPDNPEFLYKLFEYYICDKNFNKAFEILEAYSAKYPEEIKHIELDKEWVNDHMETLKTFEIKEWHLDFMLIMQAVEEFETIKKTGGFYDEQVLKDQERINELSIKAEK